MYLEIAFGRGGDITSHSLSRLRLPPFMKQLSHHSYTNNPNEGPYVVRFSSFGAGGWLGWFSACQGCRD